MTEHDRQRLERAWIRRGNLRCIHPLYQLLEHEPRDGTRAFACAMCGALVNERGETVPQDRGENIEVA